MQAPSEPAAAGQPDPPQRSKPLGSNSSLRRRRRARSTHSLTLPGLRQRKSARSTAAPGTTPGIESIEERNSRPPSGEVNVVCIDYGPDTLQRQTLPDPVAWLNQPRPPEALVRWLNVDGLHPYIVDQLRCQLGFHTLAAEDVLRVPQRPKLEPYDNHLYIVLRMVTLDEGRPRSEQVSLFLYPDLLLTIQEACGDVWDPIRQRLESPTSRLRQQGSAYLLYALLDAAVDHWFPILEAYGDTLEELEHLVLSDPSPAVQQRIHGLKGDLAMLRRIIWPTRELVQNLQREERTEIPQSVRAYLRDVYDHTIQIMDILETYRETASGLTDLYMSSISNRMNEIMKVLTLMASFFIPITFLAGVYGMNFEHIPELHWKYSYVVFWLLCGGTIGTLGFYFYRKGWIGSRPKNPGLSPPTSEGPPLNRSQDSHCSTAPPP